MKSGFFKTLCVLLALTMLVPMCGVASSAAGEFVPSIVIPGVFQSDVNLYDEDGNIALNDQGEPYSKPFFLESTTDIVFSALTEALIPISKLLISQKDKDQAAAKAIAKVAGEQVMGKVLGRDENGEPLADIRATKYGSVASCSSYDKQYIFDQIPLKDYALRAGEENLYFFSYNSFDSIKKLGDELYDYIQRVKSETGSSKVNIVPISQGGTIANSLLHGHPEVYDDLNRIVFIVPALDGTHLIGDLFTEGLIDTDEALYSELFPSLLDEDSEWLAYLINFILRIMPNADLNAILDIVVDELIRGYIKNSTCMWAFVPQASYDKAVENYITLPQDEELFAEVEWYHQAQVQSKAHILEAKARGVEVFDIVDYNHPLYNIVDNASRCNGDGIIQLDSTSMGATSYGIDVKLPQGYVSQNPVCTNPDHNHIDPYGILDASTGLLPEHSFYFYKQDHERTADNDIIIKLATELLLDDSFEDIYSYPDRFPQFNRGRKTKTLIRNLEEMKNYDLSDVSTQDRAELQAAIADVDRLINDTAVSDEDFAELQAAHSRFDAIRSKVLYGEKQVDENEAKKQNIIEMVKGFFTILLRFFSKIFFKEFGGKGYWDINKAH